MSAIPHTSRLGFGTHFSPRRLVVVLALVAALAAAALTVAIVSLATDDTSSTSAGAATPVRVIPSAPPERRHLGGHGDTIAVPGPNATPNDGSAHAGARP
jgi:hypothetical protein